MNNRNNDHLVIVTGALGGNGSAICKRLIDENYIVLGIDIENPTSTQLKNMSSFLRMNLAEVPNRAGALLEIIDDISPHTHLSLVNNAGITLPKKLSDNGAWTQYPQSYWNKTIQINLTAPFQLIEMLSQRLLAKGKSIVNITSLASHSGFPGNPAYIAAKSGLLGLTRAYAYDFGPYGIRVNSVSPGYIKTSMTMGSYSDETKRKNIQRHTSLDRWGDPADVANCVQFLLSDDANYITGADFPVDGGWLSRGLKH